MQHVPCEIHGAMSRSGPMKVSPNPCRLKVLVHLHVPLLYLPVLVPMSVRVLVPGRVYVALAFVDIFGGPFCVRVCVKAPAAVPVIEPMMAGAAASGASGSVSLKLHQPLATSVVVVVRLQFGGLLV